MSQPRPGGHKALSGAWNFRDVAETVGIRPGRLFRSSELSRLDDDGRTTLVSLGVTDVADLRSPVEVKRRGRSAVPEGMPVHSLPFPDLSHPHMEAPHEKTWQDAMTENIEGDVDEAARQWMLDAYERFPILGGAKKAVRQTILILASGQSLITHCFAGKDRTGFAVAVTLGSIGLPGEQILADFLRSNDARDSLRDRMLTSLRKREGVTPEMLAFAAERLSDAVLGVREEYLATSRRVMDETYGGLPGYLEAAEVTAEDIDRLRTQLLG